MLALERHPQQRTLVRDHAELWPNAVEELLRYDSTVASINRKLSAPIEVGDVTIPAQANVTLQLNAANRDPRRWDQPYDLRLDRDDPRPISFGHGLHHCLGHALARMELRVALSAFVERFGDYTIEPQSVEWRRSVIVRGPERLVVRRG
jgi:cytochrome P450